MLSAQPPTAIASHCKNRQRKPIATLCQSLVPNRSSFSKDCLRRKLAQPLRPHAPGEASDRGTPRSYLWVVRVVVVPPLVRRSLRIVLRRVLPLLLTAERGDVEVVPRAPHLLVAAVVDEVGAKDPVALAKERVRAVPLVDIEVLVEVVGDRVPGNVLPAVARLQPLDLTLGAREANTSVVFRAWRCPGWATWSATNEQPTQARSGYEPPSA